MSQSTRGRSALLALALAASPCGGESAATSATPFGGADTVSQEEYLRAMNGALDDLIRRLEGEDHSPVSFGASLFFAHEAAIRRMPLPVLLQMVDAFVKRLGSVALSPSLSSAKGNGSASVEPQRNRIRGTHTARILCRVRRLPRQPERKG